MRRSLVGALLVVQQRNVKLLFKRLLRGCLLLGLFRSSISHFVVEEGQRARFVLGQQGHGLDSLEVSHCLVGRHMDSVLTGFVDLVLVVDCLLLDVLQILLGL